MKSAWVALLTTSGTLVCCVMPAIFVALGAGATLAALVTRFPQLVWLSERKGTVFAVAGVALAIAGMAQLRARRLPCPMEPRAREGCMQSRRIGAIVYGIAIVLFCIGGLFAFVLG